MRGLIEKLEKKNKNMEMIKVSLDDVDSSNVHSIGYDEENRILYVRFWMDSKSKRSQVPGPIYKYFGVDKRTYLQFYYSKSKGKFIWERIRNRYRYTMIGRTGWRGPKKSRKK